MTNDARPGVGSGAAVRALGADADADAMVARALAILGEEREAWRTRRPLQRSPGS